MVWKSFLIRLECLMNPSDGKETKQVINQTANDVDLVKRLSSPFNISLRRPITSCRQPAATGISTLALSP